jgi:hypothetical protein
MERPDPDDAERARSGVRRQRQFVEIVTAIIDGEATRAAGLAAEHGHEFPHDVDVLDELFRTRSNIGGRC